MPHTGVDIPPALEARLVSPFRALCDTDWHIEKLYDFATSLGATVVRTRISRTVIDVNRDPSGRSLYPGLQTTGLCPLTTFDGEPLYLPGAQPDAAEIESRLREFFHPYHAALAAELARLRSRHVKVVLYDCHSIRSRIPRLFEGELPHFNIGTNGGKSCAPELTRAVEQACSLAAAFSKVTDGRFRGGYITRHYGRPAEGVHAIQMELAMRAYLREPAEDSAASWRPSWDGTHAAPLREALMRVLDACLEFARKAD